MRDGLKLGAFIGVGIGWMLFVALLNLAILAGAVYVVVWVLRHMGVL
jgi:hypothetical protein